MINILNFIRRNRIDSQLELLFGTDFRENTKYKRQAIKLKFGVLKAEHNRDSEQKMPMT